ncbi:MAG: hypothetical protein NVSMB32_02300 [Actinomycetota bacterium]
MLVLTQVRVLSAPLSQVGTKAATLARLARMGFPVPKFFVIGAEAYAPPLASSALAWPAPGAAVADPAGVAALRAAIVEAEVPPDLAQQVLKEFDALAGPGAAGRVAVRSSGAEEDAAAASFAGQFTSTLGVDRGQLLSAVRECWAGYLSEASLRYRAGRDIPLPGQPTFGVIVQRQVFSRKAGVLFTVHPLHPGGGHAYLEANFGTGESVVGGLVTPDAVTFCRSDGNLETRVATKQHMTTLSPGSPGGTLVEIDDGAQNSPVLSDAQARQLFELGLRAEAVLHGPQDIEWAFEEEGPWILQSRPLTGSRASGLTG